MLLTKDKFKKALKSCNKVLAKNSAYIQILTRLTELS